jgi:hypothetical protein
MVSVELGSFVHLHKLLSIRQSEGRTFEWFTLCKVKDKVNISRQLKVSEIKIQK